MKVVSIGEAMVELAPVGEGLFRRGFAGDTYNTAWHMAQLLGGRAEVGFATRVGQDSLSDSFVAGLQADGLSIAGVGRDAARTMGLYLIELDGVERRFHYWRGASAARGLADDPAGGRVPEGRSGPLDAYRFREESAGDRDEQITLSLSGDAFAVTTRPNRALDEHRRVFFERDWPAWLTGAIYRGDGA